MTARRRRFAGGLFLLVWTASASTANAVETGDRRVQVASAAKVLAMAERALRKGELAAAEIAFRALFADPAPMVRAEARFRLARMIASMGRTSEAAVLLRRILDDHPEAAPARLELAALLGKLGKQDAALRELRAVRTSGLPPGVARFVDRVSASLLASKPLGLQFELALAPDSNVNRATRSDTLGTVFGDFTVEEDSKAKSGLGAAIRGAAHAKIPLAHNVTFMTRALTDANLYRDKEFNFIGLEIIGGPEVQLGSSRLTFDLGVGQQWYGMKPHQRQLRLSGSASWPLGAVSQGRVDAAIRWSDNLVNELQDGRGVTVRGRYERALSPVMSLGVSVTADRFKARDDAYSTRSWTTGLAAHRDIGRMTVSVGAEIGRLRADERLAILPEARKDRFARFSAGMVFRQFTVGGFAPMTRIVIERNRSSVIFYDYRRTRTEFGVTRAF